MWTHNLIIIKKKLLVVHWSCGARLFGFDSTNVTINLYLVVLKITI